MAAIEVEIGEDGAIGTLPEPLQKFLDKRIADAYKKGAEKTEKALNPHLIDPVEMEKLRQRAKAADELEIGVLERDKRYEEALALRDKANAETVSAEKARTQAAIARVRAGVAKTIRASAATHGARAESLDELERLLAADVDLDDDLQEFVRDADGKPRVDADGKRITVEGLVADYLHTHAHHVAVPPSKGGRAPGGSTLAGRPPAAPSDARTAARESVAEDPSTRNIAKLLNVSLGRT